MTTISWKTGTSGGWSDASNWSPASVPGAGDDALIAAVGGYQVTVVGASVNSITLSDPLASLVSGGVLTVNNGLVITAGTLDIVTGTVVALGTLDNSGTILDSSSLELFGRYDADSIERIGGSGGAIVLAGTLANVGGTLDGTGLSQLTIDGLGTIDGGTVVGIADPGAATLDGVSGRGPLDLEQNRLTVLNGLAVTGSAGAGPGTLSFDFGTLDFVGDQTVDNASLTGRGTIIAEGTLDLGSGFAITIADFGVLSLTGTSLFTGLINNDADIKVIGQPVFPTDQGVVASISIADFDNFGTVETSGTGGLSADAVIAFTSGTVTNQAGALIGAFGGRVSFANASVLTNDGTIAADAGTVDVGGALQGAGRVTITNGGRVEFAGGVAAAQQIELSGSATLVLDQPGFFAGTVSGFAPGDAIDLGIAATPVGYSAGDLTLLTSAHQTLDLHIAGPFSLANFSVASNGVVQVNGTSAAAPMVSGVGSGGTYVPEGAAITVAGGLTVSDLGSPTLNGATAAITAGAQAGDMLSANTTGTAVTASFDITTDVLTLSGTDTLADYQHVLRSVAFSSSSVDPTAATTLPNRSISWEVNDGSTSSAPVTSTISIRPPPRLMSWMGVQNSDVGNAANWSDATNTLNPALLAPDAADTVTFASGGGNITGTATVAALSFGGSASWQMAAGALLTALDTASIGDAGFAALSITAGSTLTAAAVDVGANSDGVVAIEGMGSALTASGQLTVGDAASAELSVLGGASVVAGSADIGLGTSATGNVDIEGAGSHVDITDSLNIGAAGVGVLTLGKGTELTVAANVNIGSHGVLNQFGGVIDPAVYDNTGRSGGNGAIIATASIVNTGTLFAANGAETLTAPIITGTGALEIDANGDLALNVGAVAATQTVTFADATGVLTIGTLGGFAATIGNFVAGDSIVVQGTSIATTSFDAATHLLTLFDPSSTEAGTLQFGTSVTDGSTITVNGVTPCFMAGTRISTERGEVLVEELSVGDRVQVVHIAPPLQRNDRALGNAHGAKPVIWLGHRTVDCTRHPEPRKVWPLRVTAHAFGPNRPSRDLYLSPDHAIYIGDVLIPVKHLLNGSTVAQVRRDSVTYYHVELPRHSVLLAEGLPAESYLDTGDRLNFADGAGPTRLHPDFSTRQWEANGCAPLVVTGPALDAARRWLMAMAA
jgi:collagen type I/II/III/V/XI/XXIV/XXVII alpha